MLKFRGKANGDRNAEAGEIVYGDYCRGLSKANPSIRCWSKCCYVDLALISNILECVEVVRNGQ